MLEQAPALPFHGRLQALLLELVVAGHRCVGGGGHLRLGVIIPPVLDGGDGVVEVDHGIVEHIHAGVEAGPPCRPCRLLAPEGCHAVVHARHPRPHQLGRDEGEPVEVCVAAGGIG